jgi:hypothetical protein
LNGHEHNYQRPRPLKFLPAGPGRSAALGEKDRRVPGTFTVDRTFDGVSNTRPNGILYIVTGAGGKHLYDAGFTDNPARWTHADDGHADYVVKMVTDRHSLSVFDVDGARLTMAQIDEAGHEFDRITVTKGTRPTTDQAGYSSVQSAVARRRYRFRGALHARLKPSRYEQRQSALTSLSIGVVRTFRSAVWGSPEGLHCGRA